MKYPGVIVLTDDGSPMAWFPSEEEAMAYMALTHMEVSSGDFSRHALELEVPDDPAQTPALPQTARPRTPAVGDEVDVCRSPSLSLLAKVFSVKGTWFHSADQAGNVYERIMADEGVTWRWPAPAEKGSGSL